MRLGLLGILPLGIHLPRPQAHAWSFGETLERVSGPITKGGAPLDLGQLCILSPSGMHRPRPQAHAWSLGGTPARVGPTASIRACIWKHRQSAWFHCDNLYHPSCMQYGIARDPSPLPPFAPTCPTVFAPTLPVSAPSRFSTLCTAHAFLSSS